MLEILTPTCTATVPKAAPSALPARLSRTAKEWLPAVIAILMVMLALSIPVLLIIWRLHRSYS